MSSPPPYMYEDEHPESDDFVPMATPFGEFAALAESYSPQADAQSHLKLEERVASYLARIRVEGKPPTLSGLSLALGINSGHLKQAIREYSSSGLTTDTYYGRLMAWALGQVESYVEEGLLAGTINAAAAKLVLKRLGWDDTPTSQNMTINLSIEQIDSKLAALLNTSTSKVAELFSASPRQVPAVIDVVEYEGDDDDASEG